MGATRHPQTIPREIMKLASIATLMGGASAFVDVDKTSISIPEVGKDLFVSCEGTRMEAKITKDYISKNTQWLGNGDYIVMGVMDMTSDWEDCKGAGVGERPPSGRDHVSEVLHGLVCYLPPRFPPCRVAPRRN